MSFFLTESTFTDGAGSTSMVLDRPDHSQTTRAMPTVFIVDGDRPTRESLEVLIAREGWLAQSFASAEAFLAHPVGLAPSCLILDASLPDLSGLELQKRASAKCSHVPTIFISAKSDVPTTVEAMKAGAQEFLTKPFREDDLLTAVRESLERSRVVVARKAEKQALQERYTSLSLRQRQVLALVSSGLLNKQVAAELGISEITVKAHRGQVMQRMQADSLADLVKMAWRLGLARSREATMFHDHAGRAGYVGGQITGAYAFVA
jgi:FixJ family two-component response regulator